MYGDLMVSVNPGKVFFFHIFVPSQVTAVNMKGAPNMVFIKKLSQTDIKDLSVVVAHSQCTSYSSRK